MNDIIKDCTGPLYMNPHRLLLDIITTTCITDIIVDHHYLFSGGVGWQTDSSCSAGIDAATGQGGTYLLYSMYRFHHREVATTRDKVVIAAAKND